MGTIEEHMRALPVTRSRQGKANMPSPEVREFLQTLQSGDERAVEEMLRRLDPFLRKAIRLRLIDGRLRRVMDTADVFDSLLRDFLARPAPTANQSENNSGNNPVNASAGLHAYLAAAVHHKIRTKARKERHHAGSLPREWTATDNGPAPNQELENRDFIEAITSRLSAEDRELFDLRARGFTWPEIANQIGGNADALRMRLNRAVATILSELDADEVRSGRAKE
jgi:DNA-directed RNA polymerase specialized sigma24 family protein